MLLLEVLVGELLTVDGLATSALQRMSADYLFAILHFSPSCVCTETDCTDVATGEVTTLKHELRDNTVEGRALVAEALLASAQSTEVLGGLGNDAVVKLEVDAALLDWLAGRRVSICCRNG